VVYTRNLVLIHRHAHNATTDDAAPDRA
jgi:hypothetical protein